MDSIRIRISGKDSKAVKLAHYRAMFMNPEDVSGLNHEQNTFIIDSNIQSHEASSANPFLRWCESLGEIEIEVIDPL